MKDLINNWKELINKEYEFDKMTKIMILLLIFVFSGFFGYIYEVLFYRIDLGYFVNRGTTFGPWIPIYGFGGIFIILSTLKISKKPFLTFCAICLVTGVLEFLTGYVFFHFWNLRLWDYNTEIWNWGNIGGYICFRSVLFFGVSGLILVYLLYPVCKKIADKISKKTLVLISVIPSIICILDIILSFLSKKILG